MENIFNMDWNNRGWGERRENMSHNEFQEISLSVNFCRFQILSVLVYEIVWVSKYDL
jgi:hypothetical protein